MDEEIIRQSISKASQVVIPASEASRESSENFPLFQDRTASILSEYSVKKIRTDSSMKKKRLKKEVV